LRYNKLLASGYEFFAYPVDLHPRLIHFREHLHQKIDPPFLT
jgi:hypothetical protein